MSGEWLALGAVAALAATGVVRGSRSTRFHALKGQATPEYLDAVENNLAIMGQIVPGSQRRLRRMNATIRESGGIGGWFLPGRDEIRLTTHRQSPGIVTHQAFHALDHPDGHYLSLKTGHAARALAQRALELAEPVLVRCVDAAVEEHLSIFPPDFRTRLRAGNVPLVEALRLVAPEADPGALKRAMDMAKSPFGGMSLSMLTRNLPTDSEYLAPVLLKVGRLRPVGIPISMYGPKANEDVLQRYLDSVSATQPRKASRGYYRSLNEVYARLMDQVMREDALRRGRELVFSVRTRPDDLPLDLLPEVEDEAWQVMHGLGWTR